MKISPLSKETTFKKKVYVVTDCQYLSAIFTEEQVRDCLLLDEIGFLGSYSEQLHDQLDDLIVKANQEDPLTQLFDDETDFINYCIELSDLNEEFQILYSTGASQVARELALNYPEVFGLCPRS